MSNINIGSITSSKIIGSKMKLKKHVKEEGEHEVNITVTIAKCSPTGEKDPDPKKGDANQVQNYFHCQYKLLPDDKEYVKTDVVTFGDAAKLYGDNDSKVLRVWCEGSNTWVAWSSNRRVRVTQDTLLKMFKHKCELKFWDTKDKVSAKARFDRPKAFRLPTTMAPDEVNLDSVRSLLSIEGKINSHLGPLRIRETIDERINCHHGATIISQSTIEGDPSNQSAGSGKNVSFHREKSTISGTDSSTSKHYVSTTDSKLEVKVRLDKNKQPEFRNLLQLASSGPKPLSVDTEETEFSPELNADRQYSSQKSKGQGKSKTDKEGTSPYAALLGKDYVSEVDKINHNGLSVIPISLKTLFTSCLSISNSLKERVGSVEDVIIIVTLDKPILSEIQGNILNPMTLTIGSATQMPNNGMNFKDLSERCIPPFIRYKFHDSSQFVSEKKEHARELAFNEHNVILLGTMSEELLREFLLGPPLKIEIHDRDPKEGIKKKAGIFGSHVLDEEISNVTFTTSRINNNGGVEKCVAINYGVSEFDLSELLKGERILTLVSPIRNFSRSAVPVSNDINNNNNENMATLTKTKGYGIPPGDYLECGSELKIKIQLYRSLIKKPSPDISKKLIPSTMTNIQPICPFNRMVYIFDYKNRSFLKKIITEINEINATALDLMSYPPQVIAAALSTYKLTDKQKEDKDLDIITGCQIIDGIYHMFILEGIGKLGIARLWNRLEHPEFSEDSFFRLLYNSSMSFSQRIYLSLDVDLTRVRLHQPLANIVRQPLLYVRDIVPNHCFQAVTKLFQITQCTSLHNAIRNEMLPAAEMIVSLAKEFGIPLSEDDYNEIEIKADKEEDEVVDEIQSEVLKKSSRKTKMLSTPIDMKNDRYEQLIEERSNTGTQKDYIQCNIKSLRTLSKARARQLTVSAGADTMETAHNYSTQRWNSTEMAKEKVRQILATDPESRFTYCDRYNSATVVPVCEDKISKEQEFVSKTGWQTSNGFIYPGFKSSLESNQHPRQLDEARKHELANPWRENILHRNVVKPCVDRIHYKWEDRKLNFNSWQRPPAYFGKPAPVTIHAAGGTLKKEKLLDKIKDQMKWQKRLVVDDDNFYVHRRLITTELTDRGARASNQQDRLKDILKDDPMKLSLRQQGMNLAPIPALSVVSNPKVDTNYRKTTGDMSLTDDIEDPTEKHVGFHPGEIDGKSWLFDINAIPINDYAHAHFEETKGRDFRTVHTDRERVGMQIKPLERVEKDNHLFLVK